MLDIHNIAKCVWTPEHYTLHCDSSTCHSKTSGINLLLLQPPLIWKGFPPYFGTSLQEFGPIQPQEHQWGPSLMLGDKVVLTVGIPVHPKGVGWSWGQGSVQASQVLILSFMVLALYMGVFSCCNGNRPCSNCCQKVGTTLLSEYNCILQH